MPLVVWSLSNMIIVNRKTKEERTLQYSGSVIFLYTSIIGRVILKLINNRFVSKVVGRYMNSKISTKRINKTIKENNIDMSLFEKKEYTSFNDFFTRKKKNLNFDTNKNHFVSPADAKVLAIKLNKNSSFDIKRSNYDLKTIIKEDLSDKILYTYYEAGFGDLIMLYRFMPELVSKCKKVIFKPPVQDYSWTGGFFVHQGRIRKS